MSRGAHATVPTTAPSRKIGVENPDFIDYQTPGTRRFVRVMYAAYSSPNCSSIMRSSARTRKARSVANVTKYDGPATQLGSTSACPTEYNSNATYIG